MLGEKPAALNYAEAERMAQGAHASGQLWGIAYYRRLYPKLLRTRQLIAEGAIGQPVLVDDASIINTSFPGFAALMGQLGATMVDI